MPLSPAQFQKQLLTWFDKHGRKQLPWQHNKTPYSVWVSEIMLQQTQVATVIPYYLRFMALFPNVSALADADEDAVLHAWAGLGYYSRARHLQRAARMVVSEYSGEFPGEVEALQKLPGIGPSTAGAIMALAFEKTATILDGNVKRVLARLHGVLDPVNDKTTENLLWDIAVQYTPNKRIADYTQALMDFGATLCTRANPGCAACPFNSVCVALKLGVVTELPAKKATKKIPTRTATFLILRHEERVLLHKRPATGIWGGLFSLPEIEGLPEPDSIKTYCRIQLKLAIANYQPLASLRHTFSHYHLDIHPVLLEVKKVPVKVMAETRQIWYNLQQPETVGLPKPVQTILRELA